MLLVRGVDFVSCVGLCKVIMLSVGTDAETLKLVYAAQFYRNRRERERRVAALKLEVELREKSLNIKSSCIFIIPT